MPRRAPAQRVTLKQRKQTAAQKAGYDSTAAAASVRRQYGLVKNDQGKWVQPDAAFLQRQMSAQGWGEDQTAQTPVVVGGARWLFGAGKAVFTGERSDAAKRNPGAAYGATGQTPYNAAGLKAKKGKGRRQKKGHAALLDETAAAAAAATGGDAVDLPYAEADIATTSMLRAQGKAYAAGRESISGSRRGAEYSPEEKATEESGATARRRRHRPRNRKLRAKKGKGRRARAKKK